MYGFSFFLVLFVYLTGNLNKNRLTQKAQDPTVCHYSLQKQTCIFHWLVGTIVAACSTSAGVNETILERLPLMLYHCNIQLQKMKKGYI